MCEIGNAGPCLRSSAGTSRAEEALDVVSNFGDLAEAAKEKHWRSQPNIRKNASERSPVARDPRLLSGLSDGLPGSVKKILELFLFWWSSALRAPCPASGGMTVMPLMSMN